MMMMMSECVVILNKQSNKQFFMGRGFIPSDLNKIIKKKKDYYWNYERGDMKIYCKSNTTSQWLTAIQISPV
jgi:hypothetical protein